MHEFQKFYGEGMKQNGFGYKPFALEKKDGRLKIHFVQSKTPKKSFNRSTKTSKQIKNEVGQVLSKSGLDVEKETVIVFQNLAEYDGKSFKDTTAPYFGAWNTNLGRKGFCYTVDSELLDWDLLTKKSSQIGRGWTRVRCVF